MAGRLDGKTAIVTGASSGIGEAIAVLLSEKGVAVALNGRDEDRLHSSVEKCINASGGNRDLFISVPGDLRDPRVREELVHKTVEKFGRLDILVASAAVLNFQEGGILTATEESWDEVMDINLKSVFFLIQRAVPHLEKSHGNIVTISSVASTVPVGELIVYPLSKAALDHMTRCLSLDLASKHIRVNSVSPSHVPTRLLRSFPEEFLGAVSDDELSKQPMGTLASPDNIAQVVAFLVSDAASFITGDCVLVTGGRQFMGP